jgi:hypothetical protein
MKLAVIFVLACLLLSVAYGALGRSPPNDKSGVLCIGCTVAMRALEQFIEYKEPNIEKALTKFCELFDPKIAAFCKVFVALETYVIPPNSTKCHKQTFDRTIDQ